MIHHRKDLYGLCNKYYHWKTEEEEAEEEAIPIFAADHSDDDDSLHVSDEIASKGDVLISKLKKYGNRRKLRKKNNVKKRRFISILNVWVPLSESVDYFTKIELGMLIKRLRNIFELERTLNIGKTLAEMQGNLKYLVEVVVSNFIQNQVTFKTDCTGMKQLHNKDILLMEDVVRMNVDSTKSYLSVEHTKDAKKGKKRIREEMNDASNKKKKIIDENKMTRDLQSLKKFDDLLENEEKEKTESNNITTAPIIYEGESDEESPPGTPCGQEHPRAGKTIILPSQNTPYKSFTSSHPEVSYASSMSSVSLSSEEEEEEEESDYDDLCGQIKKKDEDESEDEEEDDDDDDDDDFYDDLIM